MKDEKRTIGYICPDCGRAVIEDKSVFALSAGRVSLSCECGKSTMEIETDGSKYHLFVPCGLCKKTHTAECSADAVLKGNGIGLACPEQGQLCCYLGEHFTVEKAMRNLETLAAKERATTEQNADPELFLDSVIMQEVLEELKDIAARPNGLSCSCGSKDVKLSVRHAAVDLICGRCGSKLRIPAATDEDLDNLCCQMTLKIKGAKA